MIPDPERPWPVMALVLPDGLDRSSAQRALGDALRPPTRRELGQWLAACAAITVSRARPEAEPKLVMFIYFERLSCYPARVVQHALLRLRWRFFPVIAELETACDRLSSDLRAAERLLRDGRLRRASERTGSPEAAEEPSQRRVSSEAARRILAEVYGGPPGAMEQPGASGWKPAGAAACAALEAEERRGEHAETT